MKLCIEENFGSSFGLSMDVVTKDERSFTCKKDVIVADDSPFNDNPEYRVPRSTDKCYYFTTRPFFNRRAADENDIKNMKSMSKGNIKSIRVVIWDRLFEKIVAEKTFYNL
jgi:hypothetical protein